MDEKKQIHRKFVITMISLVLSVAIAITLAIVALLTLENQGTAFAIIFGIMLLMLPVTSFFKSRVDQLTNLSFSARIHASPGNPLTTNRLLTKEGFYNYLNKQDYVLFSDDDIHTFYYRIKKDDIKQMFKGYIFEVVVLIKDSVNEYFLDIVDEEVQKLYREFAKEKKRVDKMLITQIREIEDLNEEEKDKVKQIVFIRTRQGIISTINVAIIRDAKKAVMLYSDKYTPSMYYSYHVNQIKKMV